MRHCSWLTPATLLLLQLREKRREVMVGLSHNLLSCAPFSFILSSFIIVTVYFILFFFSMSGANASWKRPFQFFFSPLFEIVVFLILTAYLTSFLNTTIYALISLLFFFCLCKATLLSCVSCFFFFSFVYVCVFSVIPARLTCPRRVALRTS